MTENQADQQGNSPDFEKTPLTAEQIEALYAKIGNHVANISLVTHSDVEREATRIAEEGKPEKGFLKNLGYSLWTRGKLKGQARENIRREQSLYANEGDKGQEKWAEATRLHDEKYAGEAGEEHFKAATGEQRNALEDAIYSGDMSKYKDLVIGGDLGTVLEAVKELKDADVSEGRIREELHKMTLNIGSQEERLGLAIDAQKTLEDKIVDGLIGVGIGGGIVGAVTTIAKAPSLGIALKTLGVAVPGLVGGLLGVARGWGTAKANLVKQNENEALGRAANGEKQGFVSRKLNIDSINMEKRLKEASVREHMLDAASSTNELEAILSSEKPDPVALARVLSDVRDRMDLSARTGREFFMFDGSEEGKSIYEQRNSLLSAANKAEKWLQENGGEDALRSEEDMRAIQDEIVNMVKKREVAYKRTKALWEGGKGLAKGLALGGLASFAYDLVSGNVDFSSITPRLSEFFNNLGSAAFSSFSFGNGAGLPKPTGTGILDQYPDLFDNAGDPNGEAPVGSSYDIPTGDAPESAKNSLGWPYDNPENLEEGRVKPGDLRPPFNLGEYNPEAFNAAFGESFESVKTGMHYFALLNLDPATLEMLESQGIYQPGGSDSEITQAMRALTPEQYEQIKEVVKETVKIDSYKEHEVSGVASYFMSSGRNAAGEEVLNFSTATNASGGILRVPLDANGNNIFNTDKVIQGLGGMRALVDGQNGAGFYNMVTQANANYISPAAINDILRSVDVASLQNPEDIKNFLPAHLQDSIRIQAIPNGDGTTSYLMDYSTTRYSFPPRVTVGIMDRCGQVAASIGSINPITESGQFGWTTGTTDIEIEKTEPETGVETGTESKNLESETGTYEPPEENPPETPPEETPPETPPEEETPPEDEFEGKGEDTHAYDPNLGPNDNGGGRPLYDDDLYDADGDAPVVTEEEAREANAGNEGYIGTSGTGANDGQSGAQLPGSSSGSDRVNPGTEGADGSGNTGGTREGVPEEESEGFNGETTDYTEGLDVDAGGNIASGQAEGEVATGGGDGSAAEPPASSGGYDGGTTGNYTDAEEESKISGGDF